MQEAKENLAAALDIAAATGDQTGAETAAKALSGAEENYGGMKWFPRRRGDRSAPVA